MNSLVEKCEWDYDGIIEQFKYRAHLLLPCTYCNATQKFSTSTVFRWCIVKINWGRLWELGPDSSVSCDEVLDECNNKVPIIFAKTTEKIYGWGPPLRSLNEVGPEVEK